MSVRFFLGIYSGFWGLSWRSGCHSIQYPVNQSNLLGTHVVQTDQILVVDLKTLENIETIKVLILITADSAI